MTTNSPDNRSAHEDDYPEDALEQEGGTPFEPEDLDGPEDPGTVDAFQDPEYLAEHLPEDVEAVPGTPEGDGSSPGAPSEDEDRLDAG
ncbi:hypothetical protein ACIPVK_10315 [Paeniglutamicibacter sp. MACA_103]|uniref:hypothetical protein n=1 Tax=Paeniglutamicibacter sp. MACA_103 TaxID=3377337 RepID=UPI0038958D9F